MVKSGELIGQYWVRMGKKGRVAFPKKLRQWLGGKIVVTKGYEGCLIAISQTEWKAITGSLVNQPFIVGASRDTARFLLANAAVLVPDSQGRVVLPEYLIKYAGLGKRVVFLGLGRWVEIWDGRRWEKYQRYLARNITTISEKLTGVRE